MRPPDPAPRCTAGRLPLPVSLPSPLSATLSASLSALLLGACVALVPLDEHPAPVAARPAPPALSAIPAQPPVAMLPTPAPALAVPSPAAATLPPRSPGPPAQAAERSVPTERVRFLRDDARPAPQIADADWLAAWPAWLASCQALTAERHPHRAAWREPCAQAARLAPTQGAQVREFFLHRMDRYRVEAVEGSIDEDAAALLALNGVPEARVDAAPDAILAAVAAAAAAHPELLPGDGAERERDTGLMTGYFEPRIDASRTRTGPYLTPIYAAPAPVPIEPRAQLLASGALRGHELAWLRDPIEAFFLEVQGSGRLHLTDGSWIRVAYAGSNGQPYRSIGRWLLDRGELEPGRLSMQAISDWAHAHPGRVRELLDQNPRMVFFHALPIADGDAGPLGSLGVALTPGVSVAVDPRFLPLGAPLLLSTVAPTGTAALVRVALAQDTGGAIRGPLRIDWFWGAGPEAGATAGHQHASGTVRLLVPRGIDPRDLL